ncbi:MAG: hypothetical protein ACTSO7_03395 [Candidatus Heimdallarchaeota archaeon]
MKGKKFFFVLISFIVINSLFSFLIPVNGEGTQAGILYSIPSTTPIIDGVIDPVEWQNAQPLTVELQGMYLDKGDIKIDIVMHSLYDDTDTLYLAIKINENLILTNEFIIFFQTNETFPLIQSISYPYVDRSAGNDVKWFSILNSTSDMYTVVDGITTDNSNGGTQDFDAKCTYETGNINWEVAIPFNSTDTNGFDIDVNVGKNINFFLEYTAFTTYSQFNIEYPNWDYCTLHIGSPPTVPTNWLPFIITIIGLFATSLIVIINQNKKN